MIVKSKSIRKPAFGAIISVMMKIEELEEFIGPFFPSYFLLFYNN